MPGSIRDIQKIHCAQNLLGIECKLEILLVCEYEQWDFLKRLLLEQGREFLLALSKSGFVRGVYNVNESIGVFVIVLPVGADSSLTANVPYIELEAVLGKGLDVEPLCGHDGGYILVGECLQDGCLAGVIQAKNKDSGLLVTFFESPQERKQSHYEI